MEKYIARQPIFDRKQRVIGYELLFRSGFINEFTSDDANIASASVLAQSLLPIDLDVLTRGRKAFINCTREVLIKEYPTLLPSGKVVIEILESVDPDAEVLAACSKLKQMGYEIALDDYVDSEKMTELASQADIIKVDFQKATAVERKIWARKFRSKGKTMLAEKVETRTEFDEAASLGYYYFQGYFFSKPQIITGRDIPGYRRRYLEILQAVNKLEPNTSEIEKLLKPEVSLCYKLLRYLNSAYFGFRSEIRSIRHALSLLGLYEFRKWVSLVVTAGLGNEKPDELFVLSAVRGRFCESMSPFVGLSDESSDLFLTGLFSLLEAILDSPMPVILADIPLSQEIQNALLGGDNLHGQVLKLCTAYEQGRWEACAGMCTDLGIPEAKLPDLYLSSVEWVKDLFQT
jgi:c-di-GMP-related signal transduction protein